MKKKFRQEIFSQFLPKKGGPEIGKTDTSRKAVSRVSLSNDSDVINKLKLLRFEEQETKEAFFYFLSTKKEGQFSRPENLF